MAGIDTNISNGTCYWTADNKLRQDVIPCGNAYKSDIIFSCCGVGDWCMDQGTCYHSDDHKFYVAGCTDPNYEDEACHDKGKYVTQTLMPLTICGDDVGDDSGDDAGNNDIDYDGGDGGDGDGDGGNDAPAEIKLAGCRAPVGNKPAPACTCDASNPPLLTLTSPYVPTAVLPTELGGSISFVGTQTQATESTTTASSTTSTTPTASHSPSNPPIDTATVTPTPIATPTSVPSSPTTTLDAPAPTPPHGSLSSGQIAGIASGVGIIALILIAAGVRWVQARQNEPGRQKRWWPSLNPRTPQQPDSIDPTGTALPPVAEMPESPRTVPQRPARPSDSDELHITSPLMSTMPPNLPVSPVAQYQRSISPQGPPPAQQYQAYSPEKHGDYSRYSSSHYSTDSPQHRPQYSSYGSGQPSNGQPTGPRHNGYAFSQSNGTQPTNSRHNSYGPAQLNSTQRTSSQHTGHGSDQSNNAQPTNPQHNNYEPVQSHDTPPTSSQETQTSQGQRAVRNQHWVNCHELA
ncbi:hypothetical protein LQW54_001763 [Pestalotiopsis sp. IQ-011]